MKKIISLLLVFTLLITLVSCSSKESKETSTNETSNEKVKIRLVMKDLSPSDEKSVKYIQELEKGLNGEGINVKLELVEMPAGNYAEKLNLMLTSGDIPDIIYFQGGDLTFAQQGLLEDLTPYIEKSQYIKNILQPQNIERLKNYPYLLWIKPIASKVPVVRKDWMDKIKTSKTLLENPTIDNYYAFFKELKNSQPGGKGKPSYAITVAGDIAELDTIFNVAFGNTSTWIKGNDGKYVYNKVTQNEKEKLAFYNKLYKEGLLDQEFLTKKWDTKEQAFYEGSAGVIAGTCGAVINIYDNKTKKTNGDAAKLVVLPPALGKSQGYTPVDITKESRGIAISSQSKNKELAFKVLDYLASPKGQMLDRLGFENEHYTISDGKIQLTDKFQEWFAYFWEPVEFKADKPLASPLLGEAGVESLNKAQEYYLKDINFIIPEQYTAKWDAMQNLYKEYAADIITGKRPIYDFDKFVQEWYKAGGEEITKYANENLK